MRAIDLVVFDMAGTTVEDGGQVRDAFRGALADQGIAGPAEGLPGANRPEDTLDENGHAG